MNEDADGPQRDLLATVVAYRNGGETIMVVFAGELAGELVGAVDWPGGVLGEEDMRVAGLNAHAAPLVWAVDRWRREQLE